MTRVAAVDIGTNSARLLICDVTGPGPVTDVVRRMEIVRLGAGVDRTGVLDPAALERTRIALESFGVDIAGADVHQVRVVATSATRDASNRADFVAVVSASLGVLPDVVTGTEEAALSFRGALDVLDPHAAEPVLVVDVGGGSTEFVLGGRGGTTSSVSVDIGCVRLTERHALSDPPTMGQIVDVTSDIDAALAVARRRVALDAAATLVGLAGSVTTVVAMALGLASYDPDLIHGARVAAPDVAAACAQLVAMSRAERAALGFMHPGRVDIIGAGALVVDSVVRACGVDALVASEHDILDGIARSLVPAGEQP